MLGEVRGKGRHHDWLARLSQAALVPWVLQSWSQRSPGTVLSLPGTPSSVTWDGYKQPGGSPLGCTQVGCTVFRGDFAPQKQWELVSEGHHFGSTTTSKGQTK